MWSEDLFVSLLQCNEVMEAQAGITDTDIRVRFMSYERSISRLLHQPFLWCSTAKQVALVASSCDLGFGCEGNAEGASCLTHAWAGHLTAHPKTLVLGSAFCTIRHCAPRKVSLPVDITLLPTAQGVGKEPW